jgi:dihydrodipicolinate synthase/N-acetylneuraminate lyase
MAFDIKGLLAPVVTPFDEQGEVDEKVLRDLIRFMIGKKVHALFPLGSVGQGPVMRTDQRIRVAEILVEEVRGRVPIIVHVGTPDTQTTIELAKHAAGLRVEAVAIVPPYYYPHDEYELTQHLQAVAKEIQLPILLYNNPAYSGVNVTPELAVRLVEKIPSIAGMKVAHDNLFMTLEYLRLLPSSFVVLQGFNIYLLPTVPLGVKGSVDPSTAIFPEVSLKLWDAIQNRNYEEALVLQRRMNEIFSMFYGLFQKVGRSVYQEVLRLRGFDVKLYPRWKAHPMTEEQKHTVRQVIERTRAFEA